ncbi:hypothetical protein Pedsa_1698 [Pseudopedobacter saltans DSM 12145]|uniref:Lipoprotein n=1 Tax=Pseudopedobacter saltans (strain ATCC 51119 / DSM 12145 / JCM 21818 / CCUG 39354 / LMG 10337 / NBRC 100064 / NCIMB 13643) TaxID=762903 RepID=F0S7J5_PSESL|nr:hypothetical protein [Pseudopedobacter saltans]ADY52255.1 hypothetical protein Pedsa_1698 [Pseudopedobacter saltans DSM 12145]
MKKTLISLSFFVSLFIFGCSMYNVVNYDANQRMRSINLGMSKNEVIKAMGKYYIVNSASKDSQENLKEILAYKSDVNEEYKLVFINDKLTEWNRVFTNCNEHSHKPTPSSTKNN